MASQCKRQQCTIDRRGFRQELDSWRHKLIHCVGFESILDGLFGPELVEDLKLFKDLEPVAVSDWSFDENCAFCCLRRDKVKEHLIGLSKEELEHTPKPLLGKDQTSVSRLEKQAEEFLNAVLYRKDVPNFSDPHIPVVAREILQRMIRQFAAEYTSKNSPPQDSVSDSQPCSDQSLPTTPSLRGAPPSASPAPSGAGPAHNQNPVLSKLLMADQDAPLDLTIKKTPSEPTEQDGVLDLSIKKSRSSLPARSPCLSPAPPTLKGESHDLRVAKAKDLQSTATLEQFMAKLCPHHQRQMVDAIGFLQTEVKALASSNTMQAFNSPSGTQGKAFSDAKFALEKSSPELKYSCDSTPKSEVQNMSHSIPSSYAMKKVPENAVSLKASMTASPALDLCRPGAGSNRALVTYPVDTDRHGDHAPLKMKIMASNVADGKKLSCVLNTSLSSHSDTSEDRQGNSNSSSRTESHSARLSSSVKRHSQTSHTQHARQRGTLGSAKGTPTKLFSVHMTIPSGSPRTARKTIRASPDYRTRDSACRGMADPDLGHCDIVFIDKPITECFKERQRKILPRRNARKSTRGHLYSDEIWELKTVRTLAGRGNCPNPMPDLITLVTPKQILSKPEGVPPVDITFVGACREKINQQMSTEESDESVIPGTADVVEVADIEVDNVVETSQTESQSKGQSTPPSPVQSPTENKDTDINTDVEENTTADSGRVTASEEIVAPAPSEPEKDTEPEPQEDIPESTEQIEENTSAEPLENTNIEEAETEVSSDKLSDGEPALQQDRAPSPTNQVEAEMEDNEREEIQDEQLQELQPEAQEPNDNSEVEEESSCIISTEEPIGKGLEMETSGAVGSALPLETTDDNNCDLSSKSLDSLLKELPPWRRKKGSVISVPKPLKQTQTVIVGYVNGRPVSASDRSLRRRSSNSTSPNTTPVKSSQIVAKTSAGSTIASSVESENFEKPLPETHIPAIEKVTEPLSNTATSPNSKVLSKTKHVRKQKRVQPDQDKLPVIADQPDDSPQSTDSKRQLRSTSQKPAETPDVTSISSQEPIVTNALQSPEQLPPLPPFSPLPATSSLLTGPFAPAASEQSQQNTAPKTTLELNTEQSPSVENTSEETPQKEVESGLLSKQKLRSAEVVEDENTNENQQLRSKRVLRKDTGAVDIGPPQKPNEASLEDTSTSEDGCNSSELEKPTRMPLRSESIKAEMSQQPVAQPPPVENKKPALRSQALAAPSTSALPVAGRQNDAVSPVRTMPERIFKTPVKPTAVTGPSDLLHSSGIPVIARPDPPKHTTNKFFETLTGEDNQQLISNLNVRYDKMQKGWVQMDKESQPTARYKNKADRQAAIWKSKRRARKQKSSEHQKYSPVQMLFMKGFNLTNICRWFLESTETKSLVIVKNVNTRLPSETQLFFNSSSSSGASQGVFPSLQAERLKKHLKKFAIASPVKNNPKSMKLLAKALEQEANAVRGREKREPPSITPTLTKAHSSAEACVQIGESQKSSGKSKNPASARILRKYSNIRGKMQVQQTNVGLKKVAKTLKTNNMKKLVRSNSVAKSSLKPSLKAQKSRLPVSKQMKESAAKMERRKTLASKKAVKHPIQERAAKARGIKSPASRGRTTKELPKRCSQRIGSPKASEQKLSDTSKSKMPSEPEKAEVEKHAVTKTHPVKIQTKESLHSATTDIKVSENAIEPPQQSTDVKVPSSPDQVLTRSQRKIEVTVPASGSPSHASKRVTKSMTKQRASPKPARKPEVPALTRRSALKSSAKRRRVASLTRSPTKSAKKRARDLLQTPAKRTRTSLSK
ncbi:mediator of DNA damage checkpoint protein 1 isoform X1 [Pleuronectes platessa]|uniref:mediator of DNA damage checkpoint protein 1 isoform X1 n=1 Tax=Pleuronectes platessa TaxID=8262 RepID=UPI00232A6456|nr:mediator of DNA damage checkpoint protein 1 isoform X1 [Pleuronectes platessa]